jgi:hypothetical protein
MNLNERLLQQGPRVAPEPRTAESDVVPAPSSEESSEAFGRSPAWLRILVPLAIFVGVLLVNGLLQFAGDVGAGYAQIVFWAIIAGSVLVGVVRSVRS